MAQKKVATPVAPTVSDEVKVQTMTEPAFEKAQLVGCKRYSNRKDLINELLDDGQKYTFSQVDKMIQDFDVKDVTEYKERKGDE
jgi:hypothetical protein